MNPPSQSSHRRRPQPSKQSKQSKQSSLKQALSQVPVCRDLVQGVECLRVFANGHVQRSYLTLSPDRFTLYLTTERKSTTGKDSRKTTSGGGLFTNLFGGSSNHHHHNSSSSSSTSNSPNNNTTTTTTTQYTERAMDIGAIAKLQRGHATKQFIQAT